MKKSELQILKTAHAALVAEHEAKPSAELETRIKILVAKISEIENPKTEKPKTKE